MFVFFFLMIRRPPKSPLFPYPPLFRSLGEHRHGLDAGQRPPSSPEALEAEHRPSSALDPPVVLLDQVVQDRKSTRLNSSHANISYAVFCLKKKKNTTPIYRSHSRVH